MIQPWRTLNSHHVLREPFLNLRIDQCELPDGRIAQRYCVLEFPGDWVNVVAITTDNQIILTRQYRHAAGAVFLETVGGGMEPADASPAVAAQRELREETGYMSDDFELVGLVHPNPAIQNNRMHCFLARNCRFVGGAQLDATEDLEVVLKPISEAKAMLLNGEFGQALHCTALFFALARLGWNGWR